MHLEASRPRMNRNHSTVRGAPPAKPRLEWDWPTEHADRKLEAKADAVLHGSIPFQIDRKVLKDVVREKMGIEAGRIKFLGAGTFHKGYLVTLADHTELVATVARRYMPRLKTESEVATMEYLREYTDIPVPTIYHYDSNPYNRLGGEFILMSKATGIQLGTVFHSLSYTELVKLMEDLVSKILPLFAHRFSEIGSLYNGPNPRSVSSTSPTPKASQIPYSGHPFSPTLSTTSFVSPKSLNGHTAGKSTTTTPASKREFHVGPIVSWPFFGTNRGELAHPDELNRGPWPSTKGYFESCARREITGVVLENEGRAAPHRLHLDPDEIHSSRHHRLRAVPGDESDDSDEYNLEESEDEWEGPGDAMYRDYRRMQRTTFLVAHLTKREDRVKEEMQRWRRLMDRLVKLSLPEHVGVEEFGLDCHDLSLENMFVDPEQPWKITCMIDWESTTTRPLWQCAHLPAFVQSSPFISKIFREAVVKVGRATAESSTMKFKNGKEIDLAALAREWLFQEAAGQRLRMAHRFVEWDGWEEGLIDSILGPEEVEDDWYRDLENGGSVMSSFMPPSTFSPTPALTRAVGTSPVASIIAPSFKRRQTSKLPLPLAKEREKERLLNTDGDFCGGRGGELGRRLEAWLTINGIPEGHSIAKRWEREHDSLNSPMIAGHTAHRDSPFGAHVDSGHREVLVE